MHPSTTKIDKISQDINLVKTSPLIDVPINRARFIRLTSLSLVALSIPYFNIPMRGSLGFIILVLISFLIESGQMMQKISNSAINLASKNKVILFFWLWYSIGFVVNILIRGSGISGWRLWMSPFLATAGILIVLAILNDKLAIRNFQILFILGAGIQAIMAVPYISQNIGIVRVLLGVNKGATIYGNQVYFSLVASLIPIIVWRAFVERGWKRLLYIGLAGLIIVHIIYSTFATPLGQLVVGSIIITCGAILILFKRQKKIGNFFLILLISFLALVIINVVKDDSRFEIAVKRLTNFVEDPRSGGYSKSYIKESRWYKAQYSLNSFINNPLFGVNLYNISKDPLTGGHSSFFDSLATYGLLGGGGAFILFIFLMLYKSWLRFWRNMNWETLVYLTSVILFVLGGIVNPYWGGIQPIIILLMAAPISQPDEVDSET